MPRVGPGIDSHSVIYQIYVFRADTFLVCMIYECTAHVAAWELYHLRDLLRGTIINRTHGTHKNLYISICFLPTFGPIYYGPP